MKKTVEKLEVELETNQTEPVEKSGFDGRIDVVEPTEAGTYKTTHGVKLYLSDEEVKKVLGDIDPMKYFNKGRVPTFFQKSFGRLLEADRHEQIVKEDVFKQFPDVIMLKHDLQNIYTLLIPKSLSEFELDEKGEFSERLVSCDTRSIVFTGGQGRPSAFEAEYFTKKAANIKSHLTKMAEERKVY